MESLKRFLPTKQGLFFPIFCEDPCVFLNSGTKCFDSTDFELIRTSMYYSMCFGACLEKYFPDQYKLQNENFICSQSFRTLWILYCLDICSLDDLYKSFEYSFKLDMNDTIVTFVEGFCINKGTFQKNMWSERFISSLFLGNSRFIRLCDLFSKKISSISDTFVYASSTCDLFQKVFVNNTHSLQLVQKIDQRVLHTIEYHFGELKSTLEKIGVDIYNVDFKHIPLTSNK